MEQYLCESLHSFYENYGFYLFSMQVQTLPSIREAFHPPKRWNFSRRYANFTQNIELLAYIRSKEVESARARHLISDNFI
ncbi:hypothetical protein OnM2_068038 [Erysiphe neolycopersici]|uniref:Uncharacterized protein n=1 Tax=Erysiphe neolycopersici TaxID=212602 RepID=A0A420HLD2_9PEZI|nr:hypothetical protein OnM2_068038 [Erysiphe neolycopersici]